MPPQPPPPPKPPGPCVAFPTSVVVRTLQAPLSWGKTLCGACHGRHAKGPKQHSWAAGQVSRSHLPPAVRGSPTGCPHLTVFLNPPPSIPHPTVGQPTPPSTSGGSPPQKATTYLHVPPAVPSDVLLQPLWHSPPPPSVTSVVDAQHRPQLDRTDCETVSSQGKRINLGRSRCIHKTELGALAGLCLSGAICTKMLHTKAPPPPTPKKKAADPSEFGPSKAAPPPYLGARATAPMFSPPPPQYRPPHGGPLVPSLPDSRDAHWARKCMCLILGGPLILRTSFCRQRLLCAPPQARAGGPPSLSAGARANPWRCDTISTSDVVESALQNSRSECEITASAGRRLDATEL